MDTIILYVIKYQNIPNFIPDFNYFEYETDLHFKSTPANNKLPLFTDLK